jgi:hypothetical protein
MVVAIPSGLGGDTRSRGTAAKASGPPCRDAVKEQLIARRRFRATHLDANLSCARVSRLKRQRYKFRCWRRYQWRCHVATRHQHTIVRFGLLDPTSKQIRVQLVVQCDGRERYPGPLASCYYLSLELDAVAPASSTARRRCFFNSVHVSTDLSEHDAPKTFTVTQDGMTGRLP